MFLLSSLSDQFSKLVNERFFDSSSRNMNLHIMAQTFNGDIQQRCSNYDGSYILTVLESIMCSI